MRRVELEDRRCAGARRNRRMGDDVAKETAERLLFIVVEVVLATEEQHLVQVQRVADPLHRPLGKVAIEPGAGNLRTDAPGDRAHLPARIDRGNSAHLPSPA
jgi:hypothetical protein